MAQIGLFTGTFDPVHIGHTQVAEAAVRLANLHEVWFLVNPDPLHKLAVASYPHRVAMVGEAVAGYNQLQLAPTVQANPLLHTVDGFMALMEHFPHHSFEFIIGDDAFLQLPRWKMFESVVKNTSYIVIQRSVSPHNVIQQVRSQLGHFGPLLKARPVMLPAVVPASSTHVRQNLAAQGASEWLDPRVAGYIARNGLYIPIQ